MLELKNICKTFNPGTINAKSALNDLSLTLADGDFVTVIGGNGAGKSTMLNAIAGVFPVDSGSILIDGQDVTKLPEHKRAALLGRVFQDPMMGTAPSMWIEETLALAARRGQRRGLSWGVTKEEKEQYRELLKDPYFQPSMTEMGEATFPAELRWGGAEDADGLAIPLHFEGNPEFCEMTVEQEIGLMVELHGKWFYKAPHVKTIDLMSAFFDAPLDTPADLTLNLFAPPADGVNVEDGHADWMTNYYATLQEAPKMRIRYEVPGVVG